MVRPRADRCDDSHRCYCNVQRREYAIPAVGGTITPRFDVDYRSGFNTEANPSIFNGVNYGYVNGRTLASARIAYQTEDKDWEVALSVNNLFDKFYYSNKFDRTNGYNAAQGVVGTPRTWMLSLKRNF